MKKMKTLEINGVVLDITDDGTVRFDEAQTLTDEQKAQAKENIGIQDTLIVTITDDAASHTPEEIYAHIHSGGTAVCKASETTFYNLSYVDSSYVLFSFVEDDAHVYGVKVLADGSCEQIAFSIADAISVVSSWNDLTDKPFYEEGCTEVLLEEQTFTSGYNDTYGYCYPVANVPFQFVMGETYVVTWGEDEFTCTGLDGSALMDGSVLVGNATAFGLSGNNEPFALGMLGSDMVIVCLTDTAPTEHRIAIDHDTTVIKTLDAKYLPMEAIDARIEVYISEALEGEY